MILLMFIFGTNLCWADEKPLGDITGEKDVIAKVFTGRTLDSIEGIWVRDDKLQIAIIKTSSINTPNPKYQSFDYLGVITKGNKVGEIIVYFKKTEYIFAFKGHGDGGTNDGWWKLIAPTVLLFDGKDTGYHTFLPKSFVRTYPTP